MSIGTNIKKRRFELGLSQQELADALGYKTKSTIAKIESGENGVSTKKLERFANVLHTSVEELVTGMPLMASSEEEAHYSGHRNIAVILAGGKLKNNQQNIPNQFVSVYGKPVIIYAMEAYQKHPAISDIYVVCMKGWSSIVASYAQQFGIGKLRAVLPAGETGILSVKRAIDYLEGKCNPTDTIIFQESTRPLVTEENISRLLLQYSRKGSAVTCGSMSEHLQFFREGTDLKYINRDQLIETQSPEAYRYKDLSSLFQKAVAENHVFSESCCSMFLYNHGMNLNFFEGNLSNIKIIRSEDIALFSAYVKQESFNIL